MKIVAKYLTQVYREGVYGLDDFSVVIESGDFVTVLGESGSGKTTLLRVLAGLEKPLFGELYFNGVLASDIPLKKRKTSMVFQEYVLYPRFTVWENLQTALERYDLDAAEENKRIKKALVDFDLLDVAGTLPKYLSGGQQQRVALAKAVVTRPELILFDEPLSNVAEKQRASYMQLLLDMKKKLPATTFVYVTHNTQEALTLGNKLLVMRNGKALQYGDVKKVASNPYALDVLQTLYAVECEEAELKDGKVIYRDSAIEVSADDQPVTVAFNPYVKKYCVFAQDGTNLTGQPRYITFDAEIVGDKLLAGGTEIRLDENFAYRYLGAPDKTRLAIPFDAVTAERNPESVELPADCLKNVVFAMPNKSSDEATPVRRLYFDPNAAFTTQNGARTLAHYRVYESSCYGRVAGRKLILPCGTYPYDGKNGKVSVKVKRGARAELSPVGFNGVCIAEDDFGCFRLAYFKLKGFDNYVAVKLEEKAVRVKKTKLEIDAEDMEITYI